VPPHCRLRVDDLLQPLDLGFRLRQLLALCVSYNVLAIEDRLVLGRHLTTARRPCGGVGDPHPQRRARSRRLEQIAKVVGTCIALCLQLLPLILVHPVGCNSQRRACSLWRPVRHDVEIVAHTTTNLAAEHGHRDALLL